MTHLLIPEGKLCLLIQRTGAPGRPGGYTRERKKANNALGAPRRQGPVSRRERPRAGPDRNNKHDVLVTRFEDMRDLPEIVRGIVPEFAGDFQRVSVREGSHLSAAAAVEARKFRARAARLVAANYTHRFAACDTSRFYPNATRN